MDYQPGRPTTLDGYRPTTLDGYRPVNALTPAQDWDARVTYVLDRCAADYPDLTREQVEQQLTAMYGPRPADTPAPLDLAEQRATPFPRREVVRMTTPGGPVLHAADLAALFPGSLAMLREDVKPPAPSRSMGDVEASAMSYMLGPFPPAKE